MQQTPTDRKRIHEHSKTLTDVFGKKTTFVHMAKLNSFGAMLH